MPGSKHLLGFAQVAGGWTHTIYEKSEDWVVAQRVSWRGKPIFRRSVEASFLKRRFGALICQSGRLKKNPCYRTTEG